jgi:hypothetical protein
MDGAIDATGVATAATLGEAADVAAGVGSGNEGGV